MAQAELKSTYLAHLISKHTFRVGLNDLFELKNPLVEYIPNRETRLCADLDCQDSQVCLCSLCVCCSVCVARCGCPAAQTDPNSKLAELLGFGDDAYRLAVNQQKTENCK